MENCCRGKRGLKKSQARCNKLSIRDEIKKVGIHECHGLPRIMLLCSLQRETTDNPDETQNSTLVKVANCFTVVAQEGDVVSSVKSKVAYHPSWCSVVYQLRW